MSKENQGKKQSDKSSPQKTAKQKRIDKVTKRLAKHQSDKLSTD